MRKSLFIIFALLLLFSPAVGEDAKEPDLSVEPIDLSKIPGLDGSYDLLDLKLNDDLMGITQPILDGTFLEDQEEEIKPLGTMLGQDSLTNSLNDPTKPLGTPTYGLGGYTTDIEAIMKPPGSGRKKNQSEKTPAGYGNAYNNSVLPDRLRDDKKPSGGYTDRLSEKEKELNDGYTDEDRAFIKALTTSIPGLDEAAKKGEFTSNDEFQQLLR